MTHEFLFGSASHRTRHFIDRAAMLGVNQCKTSGNLFYIRICLLPDVFQTQDTISSSHLLCKCSRVR